MSQHPCASLFADAATRALRQNLCEFPARFSKCIAIRAASELHMATATLVNLGQGPLAVTCAHVVGDYLDRWEGGDAAVRIGNSRILRSQLAGFDNDLDLAVIRLTAQQEASLVNEEGIATQFYHPPIWPPPRGVEADERVAIGGFPAQWRRIYPEKREIVSAFYGVGATRVTSVSDRQFGCRFERESWIWMSRDETLTDLSTLGGLSGGPVFAERYLHRMWVGIVTNFRDDWDIMLMSHADWVKGDGSLRTDKPWSARCD